MKKLLFGRPVEMSDTATCDFCDEKKPCFVGLTRTRNVCSVEYDTHYKTFGESIFSIGTLERVVDDTRVEENPIEFTFAICPDCVKQLAKFTKEIKE